MSRKSILAKRSMVMAACAGVLGAAGAAYGATWNGGGADDNWTTPGNWGGTAPVADDPLAFGGLLRLTNTNDFGTNVAFSGITFNAGAGAFTLNGAPVVLGGANVGATPANFTGFTQVNG